VTGAPSWVMGQRGRNPHPEGSHSQVYPFTAFARQLPAAIDHARHVTAVWREEGDGAAEPESVLPQPASTAAGG